MAPSTAIRRGLDFHSGQEKQDHKSRMKKPGMTGPVHQRKSN